MATIVTRAGKGSTLSWTEADANFTNLNTDLVAAQADIAATEIVADGAVQKSVVDAKGDILIATAADTVSKVTVGSDGKVLTANSANATGVSWETPAATAAAITFTPVGTVSATNVQDAIAEVAAEATATTVASDSIWDAKGDVVVATAANTAIRVAVGADGYVMTADSAETSGVKWNEPGTTSAPTVQTFTSGSGTYTKPAGCTRIHVRMVGGGGGGGPSGTAGGTSGVAGGNTTFGLHTANGGAGGTRDGLGATGGTATLGAGIVGVAIGGAQGSSANRALATNEVADGGHGASAPYFGGGGAGGVVTGSGLGSAGQTNTGSGGGGGYVAAAAGAATGAGGGSGGYLEGIISAPSSTYSYAVGAAGTAGVAGTNGYAGGAGAAGQIIVTEYYGNFDSVLQLNEPASTKQEFTSGSGTYTTPAGVNRIRVRMVGGGGGGAGGGTASWGAGGSGGTSTFGSSLLTAGGGSPGINYASGGGGGGATVSSPAVGVAVTGSNGTYGEFSSNVSYSRGGDGGNAPFFAGGAAGGSAGGSAGVVVTNSGGGGGGGSTASIASSGAGTGGGSGSYLDAWIWNPSSTYAYAVGAAGSAGAAGTSGFAGSAGAAGRIIVEEFYGPTHTVADTQPLSGWPGRNRIINGDFRIDQRNAGVATTATALTYAADRWQSLDNCDGTFTTDADHASSPPPGFASYMRVAVTSADASLAAGQYAIIQQKIEGTNCADLDFGLSTAKTVTLSFRVRSSLTGTFSGAVCNGAANRSYPFTYTISAANTWETKTITIAGDTTGTWLTTTGIGLYVMLSLGTGSTYLGTAGAWGGTLYLGATGETPLIGTNGATWDITGVQLEPGSVRTEFERESYSALLEKCQRYYEPCVTQTHAMVLTAATTTMYVPYYFKVSKRTAPTIVTPSSTNAAYSSSLATITPTSWSGENPTTESFGIVIGHASGVGGHLAGQVFTASAEL
jgi:hypothetical protein